jgi:hypothetical protein|tara:strand:- start:20519 stop:21460 length:942 start_codon:yes stop_codon:yes gene_type:complete
MALGNYGIKRPADVSPNDVEIIYHYQATRDANSSFTLGTLPSSVLTYHVHNNTTASNGAIAGTTILGGLYQLTLPSTVFSNKGFYTVYVRPVEIRTEILDCGVLAALPNVKGLVIDLTKVPAQFKNRFVNMGLIGYRVEYMNSDNIQSNLAGTKIPNFFRIVTSSFYCEKLMNTAANPNKVSPRYAYTDSPSNLVFLTLSPSSAPTNQPNALPDIGKAGQKIIITNTYFNPVVLEVEMADHDFDTLAIGLYGNQTKSIEDGIYTMYDLSGVNNIYKQYNLFEIRDQFDEQLFEVRQDRGNQIDFSKQFGTIVS